MDKQGNAIIATAIMAAVIIYGSLYPFRLGDAAAGLGGAIQELVDSWNRPPSRSDLVANIFLYVPFGFFAVTALGTGRSAATRILLTTLCGAALSVAMELLQYFDAGRVTNASDVYTNSAGALCGAIAASYAKIRLHRLPLATEIARQPIPALLLTAWIGYRLFPFVPTIDLHKYWHALKPVISYQSLTGYDLFRYTAIWLAIAELIAAIVGQRRVRPLFWVFIAAVVVGQVMIVGTRLGVAELAGALTALLARELLAVNASFRTALTALLFCSSVVAERLEPFRFGLTPRPFGWIPFLGFMSGALDIDVLSFLQKFFLYGGSIWLLAMAGLRWRGATLLMAAALLVTSEAERYLPNRSAELTDALMALIVGLVFALVAPASPQPAAPRAG